MKSNFLLIILFPLVLFGQNEYNFGFEKSNNIFSMPTSWFRWGEGYSLIPDTSIKHSGKFSVLITPQKEHTSESFGCIATSMPALYSCKKIEVRAWMKFENVTDGPVGLLLRIDGVSHPLEFDNMQKKNIRGTSDWKQYSVKLPYPKNAKTIYIGALLSGGGKLWVDDFEVYVDGKSIENVSTEKKEIPPAEKDHEFDLSSRIQPIEVNEFKTSNLILLGQVWGFLKYYHPFIAKGNLNWDYELFRILTKILDTKTTTERNELLCCWIDSLGTVKPGKTVKADKSKVKLQPDLSFIDKSI